MIYPRNYIRHRVIFLFTALVWVSYLSAQAPQVQTSIDKNQILIGERIYYKVNFVMPDNTFRLTWFSIPDSFGSFVVVQEKKIDSSFANGNLLFSQELVLTSFDSGRRTIPPLTFELDQLTGDSSFQLITDTIPVNVLYSPLDSVKTFHDIKPIIEVEKERPWWIYALIGLVMLIIILLIAFRKKIFKRKEKQAEVISAKLSAYDEAIKALKKLEQEKLLTGGQPKEFHLRLTEIFKRYFTRKTNINKLHLTSDEILMELNEYSLTKENVSAFANSLRMSNAVKFAKYAPPEIESLECLSVTKDMIKKIDQELKTPQESAV
ncbi:MAG: hypothetical protein ABIR19_05430 [Ginsengibacter sp.]